MTGSRSTLWPQSNKAVHYSNTDMHDSSLRCSSKSIHSLGLACFTPRVKHVQCTTSSWVEPDLLNLPDDLKLGSGVEVHALFAQQQAQVAGHISASHVHPHDAVGHGKALVHRHCMCHSIASIQHHTCCTTCGVPAQPYLLQHLKIPDMQNWMIITNVQAMNVLYWMHSGVSW